MLLLLFALLLFLPLLLLRIQDSKILDWNQESGELKS